MAFLSWRDALGENQETQFGDALMLGRSADSQVHHAGGLLQFPDPHVSRKHAQIERTFRGMELVDLGSSNGTRVNGTPLVGYHLLGEGDVIGIGETILTYREHRIRGFAFVGGVENSALAARVQRVEDEDADLPESSLVDDPEVLRQGYERLRVARIFHRAVGTGLDRDAALTQIAEAALSLFHAEHAAVLLLNPRNGEYEPERIVHAAGADARAVLQMPRYVLHEVVQARTSLLSRVVVASSDGPPGTTHWTGRVSMSAPLVAGDEVRGVLHLEARSRAGIFDNAALSLLQEFCQHAIRALQLAELAETRGQQAAAEQRLRRLLPEAIVAEVMKGKQEMKRGGVQRDATVLFCDIRGFTSLSERLPAAEVVEMLNEYFELLVEQVFAFDGALDKFIGDELMAVWGAHVALEDHAYKAVCAALEMQAAIARMNALRRARGLTEISAGVGINTGPLLAGYMGARRAMSYTVIGDNVNIAARLCSVAASDEIVVSTAVAEAVAGRVALQALPPQSLKGKSETVELYRVLRHR